MKTFIFLFSIFLTGCVARNPKNESPVSISGIYPHLAMFNSAGECGSGAVVPWASRLWVITYAQHAPYGSDDNLYEIDTLLRRKVRQESIGGTPANRMIHDASKQLIIGPYFIDDEKNVRMVPYKNMPGRLTATAAHLTNPENKVYMATMEEGLYEVNVHSLDVKVIYPDGNTNPDGDIDQPRLPGYHGKGAYTSQGFLVYANNGEWKASKDPAYSGPAGCLAEWDGKTWQVVERKQFTEVTGPGGIHGNTKTSDPLWSLGWDKRSVILKLLDHKKWYTYRLPKASFTYGAKNGWFTEWPRIREINDGRMLMTMFGMFWDFPKFFSQGNTAGIRPLSSYLKIIGDFAWWNDHIVFGCDDASKFGNKFVTQAQSNLWFVKPEDLEHLGPANGYGGVWLEDTLQAGVPSDPYLVNGFDHLMIHLANGFGQPVTFALEENTGGDDQWKAFREITVPARGYRYFIFPSGFQAQWVRVKANRAAGPVTAYLFTSNDDLRPLHAKPDLFGSLPDAGSREAYSFGLVRPRGHNRGTLQFVAMKHDGNGEVSDLGYYETDEDMVIRKVDNDSALAWMQENVAIENRNIAVDAASVILTDAAGHRFRLPIGDTLFYQCKMEHRAFREVVTERSLLNTMGTFFEVPRPSAGGFAGIKPVCTHNRIIYDYCSWRGMLVLSGNLTGAGDNGNYFRSKDGQAGLWFGTIDDLWKLGKPHGTGGPWLKTPVKAGEPSDPYLMTGYDKKTLHLQTDKNVEITAEICIDPDLTEWVVLKTFSVKKDGITKYMLPDGYEAHWIRFKAGKDCRATATLIYQ